MPITLSRREDLKSRLVGRALALEMTAFTAGDRETADLLREAAAELVQRTDPGLATRILQRQFPSGFSHLCGGK
jgi:hypothetical protein